MDLKRTMKILKPNFLLLMTALVFVTGCAHQRLSESANENLQQGRYELALQDYEQALALKPNNRQNLEGKLQAQRQLDLWLDRVQETADSAYARAEKGKALLLYAKIMELRNTPQAVRRYQSLLGEISEAQQLSLKLSGDAGIFGADFGASIPGLTLVSNAKAGESYTFSVANYQGKTLLEEKRLSQTYLADIETLANPEFLFRQNEIHENKSTLRAIKQDFKGLKHRLKKLNGSLNSSQSRIQQLEASTETLTPGSKPYQRVQATLEREKANRRKLKHKISETHERVKHAQHERHHYTDALDRNYEVLSLLAPTIEREIFADYEYTVGYLTQTMKADLHVRNRGQLEKMSVVYTHTDSEHDAHPTIDLAEKEAFSETQKNMRNGADREALKRARSFVSELVSEHRYQIKVAGDNTANPRLRFEYRVAYLLAGDQSSDAQLEHDIRRHLELELGHAGEFRIAHLLHLYGS